jgi:Rrf2 family transcriptional regulator, iron-sulfur cluster assembly transcription factor
MGRDPFLAVEVLARLTSCNEDKPGNTEWLAESIHRSISYTEALMAQLRRAGFVKARRGLGGGYFLSRRADQVSVADVFQALDEPGRPCGWLFTPPSVAESRIDTLRGTELLWESLRSYIFLFLSGVSVADIAPVDEGALPVDSMGHPRSSRDKRRRAALQ